MSVINNSTVLCVCKYCQASLGYVFEDISTTPSQMIKVKYQHPSGVVFNGKVNPLDPKHLDKFMAMVNSVPACTSFVQIPKKTVLQKFTDVVSKIVPRRNAYSPLIDQCASDPSFSEFEEIEMEFLSLPPLKTAPFTIPVDSKITCPWYVVGEVLKKRERSPLHYLLRNALVSTRYNMNCPIVWKHVLPDYFWYSLNPYCTVSPSKYCREHMVTSHEIELDHLYPRDLSQNKIFPTRYSFEQQGKFSFSSHEATPSSTPSEVSSSASDDSFKIKDIFRGLSGASKLEHHFEGFNENMIRLMGQIDRGLAAYADSQAKFPNSNLSDSIIKAIERSKDEIKIGLSGEAKVSIFEKFLVFGACVYLFLTFNHWSQTLALVTLVGAAFGIGSQIVKWFENNKDSFETLKQSCSVERIKQFLSPTPSFSQQSDDFAWIALIKILTTGICTIMTGTDKSSLPSYVKIGNYARMFNSVTSMSEGLSKSLGIVKELITEVVTGLPMAIDKIDQFVVDVEQWGTMCDNTVLDSTWNSSYLSNPNSRKILEDLLKVGTDLLERSGMERANSHITMLIRDKLRDIKDAKKVLEQTMGITRVANEPTFILIAGSTSLGKTFMTRNIVLDLFAKEDKIVRDGYNYERLIFSKNSSAKYNDCYGHQFCILIDELFQSSAEQDRIDTCGMIIDLVNCSGTPLDMASCDLKGKISQNSHYVLGTTNVLDWSTMPIASPMALKRRRDVIIIPVLKPAFSRNSKLDVPGWVNYCKANSLDSSIPDYATFNILDREADNPNHPISSGLTYNQVIDYVFDVKSQKNKVFSDANSLWKDKFERALAQQGDSSSPPTLASLKQDLDVMYNGRTGGSFRSNVLDIAHLAPLFNNFQGLDYTNKDLFTSSLQNHPDAAGFLIYCTSLDEDSCRKLYLSALIYDDTHSEIRKKLANTYYLTKSSKFQLADSNQNFLKVVKFYEKPQFTFGERVKNWFISLKDNTPWKEIGMIVSGIGLLITVICLIGYFSSSRKGKSSKTESDSSLTPKDSKIIPQKFVSWFNINKAESMDSSLNPKGSKQIPRQFSVSRFFPKQESGDNVQVIDGNINVAYDSNSDFQAKFKLTPQALFDPQWESMCPNALRNVAIVKLMSMGTCISKTRGIMVASDHLLIPKHLMRPLTSRASAFLCVQIPSGLFSVLVSDCKFSMMPNSRWKYDDACVVKLPRNTCPAKNLVKYFCTMKEIESTSDFYGELLLPQDDHVKRFGCQFQNFSEKVGNPINVTEDLVATVGWSYIAPTVNGDCGAPIVKWDPKCGSKIVGIHSAGDTQGGGLGCFGQMIDQEWLSECVTVEYELQGISEKGIDAPSHLIKPCMYVLGKLSKTQRVKIPEQTSKIVPSVFQKHSVFPVRTAPVEANSNPGRSLDKALGKFVSFSPPVDRQLVKNITNQFVLKNSLLDERYSRQVFDYSEALNSVQGLNSININSSMGFPYVVNKVKKEQVVEYNPSTCKFEYISDDFLRDVQDEDEMMRKGQVPEVNWLVYMKDERLPLHKITDDKIRLFYSCPFTFTILVRKYFGSFLGMIHETRHKTGIMIGVDPHSIEWDKIARSLLGAGSKFYNEDFKNWDRTIPKVFLEMFFEVADMFYYNASPEEKSARNVIRHLIINAVFQLNFFRFITVSGNPSGSPVTAEINSFANIILLFYTLMNQGYTAGEIMDKIKAYVYGDDRIWTIDLPIDYEKYKEMIAALGMTITTISKDGSTLVAIPFGKCEFLRRRFVLQDNVYKGPLDIETIQESLLWLRGTKNQKLTLEDTVRNAMTELQLHPPMSVADTYRKILQVCVSAGLDYPVSDHLISALMGKQEAWSGTNLEKLQIMFGASVYSQFTTPIKNAISIDKIHKFLEGQITYVGLDLARYIPALTPKVFYHVGFRSTSLPQFELCYSDAGMVFVPSCYQSDFEASVILDIERVTYFYYNPRPYHRVTFNCIVWAEYLLEENYPQLLGTHSRLVDYVNRYYPCMLSQQGDETLSTNFVDPPISTEITVPNNAPYIPFPEIQQRSIDELLETEEIIKKLYWTNSHAQGATLAALEFPKDLLAIPQFSQKLNFNCFFSARVSIWIKLSSTPFQCGKLMAVWLPQGDSGWPANIEIDYRAMTAMPHAQADASVQKECLLEFPFVHTLNSYNLPEKGKTSNIGTLFILVLNKLGDASTSKRVGVTIAANFRDVKMYAPTPFPVDGGTQNVFTEMVVQSDEATEKSEQGIVSGIATQVGGIARLVGRIPIFNSVASSVAAVSEGIGGVARMLGLSKPDSLESTRPVIPRPFTSVSHSDGLDMSSVLATSSRNSVKIQPSLFGSLVDEMSIDYLVKTPTLLTTKQWGTSASLENPIINIPVHPLLHVRQDVAEEHITLAGNSNTMLSFVSMAFKYWRGTINFRLQIVCSEYHRGTLVVAFIPQQSSRANVSLSTTTHFKIDIAEKREFDFSVPFISNRLYHNVDSIFNAKDYVASVQVFVYTPLIAPSTVVQSVDLNLWVYGGNDFSLSLPTLDNIASLNYGTNLSSVLAPSLNFELLNFIDSFEQQGLFDEDESLTLGIRRGDSQLGPNPVTFSKLSYPRSDVSDWVMGENIYNLRDILKIFTKRFTTKLNLRPYAEAEMTFPVHSFNPASAQHQQVTVNDNYLDHFLRIFRYSRGSLRFKFALSQDDYVVSVVVTNKAPIANWTWQPVSKFSQEGAPWAFCAAKLNPTLEFRVPFYSTEKQNIHNREEVLRYVCIKVRSLSARSIKASILCYNAIGDDYSAGYLLGPPPTFLKFENSIDLSIHLKELYAEGVYFDTLDGTYHPRLVKPQRLDASITEEQTSTEHEVSIFSATQMIYYKNKMLSPKICVVCPIDDRFSANTAVIVRQTPFPDNPGFAFCLLDNKFAEDKGSMTYDWDVSPFCGMWFLAWTQEKLCHFSTTSTYKYITPNDWRVVSFDSVLNMLQNVWQLSCKGKIHTRYQ